ncbi:hypothetical protein [Pilimelia terevasa]|nr:hypothetical protein [Pilimelia terevasa]
MPESHRRRRRRPGDSRPAPGRTSERASDSAGVHRSHSRLRSRGALVGVAAAAALAVGAPIAARLQSAPPAEHVIADALDTEWPSTPGPGLDVPDAVLPSASLRPGAPIRGASPSARASASPAASRSPSRAPATRPATRLAGLSFEAESSTNDLNAGTRIRAVGGASGGLVVTDLGGRNSLGVRVPLSQGGARRVTIHYVAAGTRAANLSVNGSFAASTAFPGTGGRVGSLTVPIALRAGVNILGFSNPAGAAPDIDRVVVAR